jgi:3-oxoadipate enol-lactonase/4-carboxymuconolactone decarboxylase
VNALGLRAVHTPGPAGAPALILLPSLGTAARSVADCADALSGSLAVLTVDLPGHGRSAPVTSAVDVADIAAAVFTLARDAGLDSFAVAGVSLGGAVGIELALRHPEAVTSLAVICSAARIGDAAGWRQRAVTVRGQGTASLVSDSAGRWFAPGFIEARPELVGAMLHDLSDTDDESYARCCEALAVFDAAPRLGGVRCPTVVLAGEHDAVIPVADAVLLADGVPAGRATIIRGAGHLAPTERPAETAAVLLRHIRDADTRSPGSGSDSDSDSNSTSAVGAEPSVSDAPFDRGMRVRRAVLGDDHVDAAVAAIDDTTRDFQDFLTRYAWGEIWSRPGLDRRTRSVVTLTALVANGNLAELGLHVRAALRNGLAVHEITEVLLQCSVYCGVPRANAAFAVAQPILAEARQ